MSLQSTIDQEYKGALKKREAVALSAYRMLKSAIKNAEIEARHELTDEETLAVITREAKRRRESITMFTEGGRNDLAEREQAELAIIERHLPAQMTDQDLERNVREVITARNASAKDFGPVMSAVMARVKGQADGVRVSAMVKKLLS